MTNDEVFILPISNGVDSSSYIYVQYNENEGSNFINLEQIEKIKNPIVSWNLAQSFIDQKVEHQLLSSSLIDLETLAKYYFGLPKKDFNKDVPWSLFNLLKDEFSSEAEVVSIHKKLRGFKQSRIFNEKDLFSLIQKFANSYFRIKKELAGTSEWERFIKVEVPISTIFINRSISGITVSKEKIEIALNSIESEYFRCLSILRSKFGYMAADISDGSIKLHLSKTNPNLLLDQNSDIISFLKIRKHISEHFALLLSCLKNQRTKRILLVLLFDLQDKVHPIFDISGTVTSRILTISPNLQNISKSFRNVIVPDLNKNFLYLDYSCFEPSIMAGLSKDENLISLCKSEDLYNEICKKAGYDTQYRKTFKTIFLAFSFGMNETNLIAFIMEILEIDKLASIHIYEAVFKNFKRLQEWKEEIWKSTIKNGSSESLFGNRRRRKINLPQLTFDEQRWSINQVVQGTASLILKSAILKIHSKYSSQIDVLLPMHDAILLQGTTDFMEKETENIKKLMQQAFTDFFPTMNVRISIEPFSNK